jgi:hypothetical protein
VNLDRTVDAEEGLHARRLFVVEHHGVLLVILDPVELGDDAQQVRSNEGLDVPGALDPVVDQTQPERHAKKHEYKNAGAVSRDSLQVGRVG